MDINGRAMMNPARIGFLPESDEANAMIRPDKIVLIANHISIKESSPMHDEPGKTDERKKTCGRFGHDHARAQKIIFKIDLISAVTAQDVEPKEVKVVGIE